MEQNAGKRLTPELFYCHVGQIRQNACGKVRLDQVEGTMKTANKEREKRIRVD
jgi:hypothetical protein